MPFRAAVAGVVSSQVSQACRLPSGDQDPVPQPTFSVGSSIGNGVYPVPSALMVAVPILPSAVGYGKASLLPSGEKSAQQLTGLAATSTRFWLPSGFAITTAFSPVIGSMILSYVISPLTPRGLAPAWATPIAVNAATAAS